MLHTTDFDDFKPETYLFVLCSIPVCLLCDLKKEEFNMKKIKDGDLLIFSSHGSHWEIIEEAVVFIGIRKNVNLEGYSEEAILVQNASKEQKWVLRSKVRKLQI